MSAKVSVFLLGVLGLFCLGTSLEAAPDMGLKRCTKSFTLTSETRVEISASPSIVCTTEFIANGSNGFGYLFDSPDSTDETHVQARIISELGAATSGNSAFVHYGDRGKLSHFSLGGYVVNGTMIVHYDD